jgi:hypothetical protein
MTWIYTISMIEGGIEIHMPAFLKSVQHLALVLECTFIKEISYSAEGASSTVVWSCLRRLAKLADWNLALVPKSLSFNYQEMQNNERACSLLRPRFYNPSVRSGYSGHRPSPLERTLRF